MIQAPNCSNQRDEDTKLSHTRNEKRERHQASRQATSNKKQSMKEHGTAPPSAWLVLILLLLVLVLEREVD